MTKSAPSSLAQQGLRQHRKQALLLSSPSSAKTRPKRPARAAGATSNPLRLALVIACSICLAACLLTPVECGRLQDFIQNLVGGGAGSSSSSSSNSNSNKENSNTNSNSNSNNNNNNNNDSADSDTAASNDSNEQPLTPMMSAMNPFMRYPSFYDGFGSGAFGSAAGFPGMSAFSGPMASAMSAMSPMAAMSSNSLSGAAFSPSAFSPASFGHAFGSSASSGLAGLGAFTSPSGMSASSLNNVYAQSAPATAFMAGYSPYYGRRR